MSCGSAASLAESLRLSVMAAILSAATPARGEASPFKKRTESRRLSAREGGKAATDWAKPHPMIANA